MNAPDRLRGLYAITSSQICSDGARLLVAVEAALLGGAGLIQYRDKLSPAPLRLRQARLLAGLCHRLGGRLIINDDPRLAQAAGADGVHLGAADPPIAEARALLGAGALIGASCGRSLERAVQAAAEGADYVAFGRFYPSKTKPEASPAPLSLLAEARAALKLPICAIGGILPGNAPPLLAAGADLIAAVDGVFGANDVRAAAAAYAGLFTSKSST